MDGRRFWIMVLVSAWVLAWAVSLASLWLVAPEGSGFVRGMNRLSTFAGWQAVAAMLALAAYGLGRAFDPDTPTRRLARAPLRLTAVAALLFAAFALWAMAI